MGVRSIVRVVVIAVMLAVPMAGAQAGGFRSTSRQTAEYVVAYSPAAKADVLAAIRRAGGVVTGTVDALGLARVSVSDPNFRGGIASVRSVRGVIRNQSVGTTRPGMPHRIVTERPTAAMIAAAGHAKPAAPKKSHGGSEPLAALQWDMAMIGATPNGAWKKATGRGVQVGIMDTGVDASHPDIAPNFNAKLSRNFTMDIPAIDGPCDTPTCIDPANVDQGGHGTHVAGTVAAARNGIGITGVAPRAQIVNIRAGQDSGYFFLYETTAALVYAGDIHLDVVNMSFFTDPWLFNCDSADDYVSGTVTAEQLQEQAMVRQVLLAATAYAGNRGVTLVAAAGNEHLNLALPTRPDTISPDYPPGTETPRVVTNDCLDLPGEAPNVIQTSAVGPSTTKADYSSYGLGSVDIAAPGGWFRDGVGTPTFQTPGNLILSTYPRALAIEEGLADAQGHPVDAFSSEDCSVSPCAFYTRLQGTSMASPHAAGVAALIIERFGRGNPSKGFSLAPSAVKSRLLASATDHACPAGGVEIYTDEGRPAEFNAVCDGTTANNGLYGQGIINAKKAVR